MTPNEIKTRRLALNMTQAELAAAFELDVNTVARWERGERAPIMPGVLRLAFQSLEQQRAVDTRLDELKQRNLDGLARARVRHSALSKSVK